MPEAAMINASDAQSPPDTNAPMFPPTELLYMASVESSSWLECMAHLLQLTDLDRDSQALETNEANNDNGRQRRNVAAILDRTVLHCQGGGQPSDEGTLTIVEEEGKDQDNISRPLIIHVEKVTLDRDSGVVTHTGFVEWDVDQAPPPLLEQLLTTQNVSSNNPIPVQVQVDASTRAILSECHSAGHALDRAVTMCGLPWKPLKGYHFLQGPYVEYQMLQDDTPPTTTSANSNTNTNKKKGKNNQNASSSATDELLRQLQTAFDSLLQQDWPTEITWMTPEQANLLDEASAVPSSSPTTTGNPAAPLEHDETNETTTNDDTTTDRVRVVTVAGQSCPCGGTHVSHIRQLQGPDRTWSIHSLKRKKQVMRVKYGYDTATNSTTTTTTTQTS